MKKLLISGLLLSAVAMAGTFEVRIGGDLSSNGKFEGGLSSGADLTKNAIKNGVELSAEYRTFVTDNFDLGAGISYKINRLNSKGFTESEGIHAVPVYFTARYHFANSTEVTPYIKGNLGYAFTSGNAKWYDSPTINGNAKFKGGVYTGIGFGIQYTNFVADLSYNWNRMNVDRNGVLSSTKYSDDFILSHGVLTFGIGYSFEF